jgi:pimeloyl-ACP methyl ester carboxylesterase
MWHWEQQQKLSTSHFRIITLDLLGSGLSDKPDLDYSPEYMVSFFLAFMDKLGIPQATLIGNSMGAGLAMGVAITAPTRVSHLVLISGFPPNVRKNLTSPMYQGLINRQPPLWVMKFANYLAGRWATKMALQEIIFNPQLLTPAVIDRSYHNRSTGDAFGPGKLHLPPESLTLHSPRSFCGEPKIASFPLPWGTHSRHSFPTPHLQPFLRPAIYLNGNSPN